jgi:hypothetical protein
MKTFIKLWLLLACISILFAVCNGCKNKEGIPRNIFVTWSDTVNYRSYLGKLKHCATPNESFYVTVASGQYFIFEVTTADSLCINGKRNYIVTIKQGNKIIYMENNNHHNIKVKIY